jgi:hypothetical protein
MVYRAADHGATRDRQANALREAREIASFRGKVRALPWRSILVGAALATILPQTGCAIGAWLGDNGSFFEGPNPVPVLVGWLVGCTLAIWGFARLRNRKRTRIGQGALSAESMGMPNVHSDEDALLQSIAVARCRARS